MLEFNKKHETALQKPWFQSWFDESVYDIIYSHRGANEAIQVVKLLEGLCQAYGDNISTSQVLDIGCGNCRHLPSLKSISNNIIGLDLSQRQLNNGAKFLKTLDLDTANRILRADMRQLPLKPDSLGLITNFFTSFGYFSNDADHQATLVDWSKTLKKNGLLFLDLFNKKHVITNLVPHSIKHVDGYKITQTRTISKDNKRIEKTVDIYSEDENKSFQESVRLFTLDEISEMLINANFKILETRGSYLGDTFSSSSERLIILAQKC